MNPLLPRLIRSALFAGSALMFLSCATPPPGAPEILARSSQAMGTGQLNTVRYTAEGTGRPSGRRSGPAALAEDQARIGHAHDRLRARRDARRGRAERAEALGGGGYPHPVRSATTSS